MTLYRSQIPTRLPTAGTLYPKAWQLPNCAHMTAQSAADAASTVVMNLVDDCSMVTPLTPQFRVAGGCGTSAQDGPVGVGVALGVEVVEVVVVDEDDASGAQSKQLASKARPTTDVVARPRRAMTAVDCPKACVER